MIAKRNLRLYGMIAAVHGIMIWFYQMPFPNPANVHQPVNRSQVIMAAGTEWNASLNEHPLTRDPLLLARAHANGFTGGLWNKSFQSPNPYSDWNESPKYLDKPELEWGEALGDFVDNTSQSLWKPLTKPDIKLEVMGMQHHKPVGVSTFNFSSNLKDRIPKNPPELPLWQGPQPIAPTRIKIGVNPMGMILSARLLNHAETDSVQKDFLKQAVRITKRLRFQPIQNPLYPASEKPQWGELEIQWQQAPPETDQKTNSSQEIEVR